MSELMIVVALWCGQVLVQQHGMYIKPQATTAQVDQCRKEILDCINVNQGRFAEIEAEKCFKDQKLPGGK